MIGRSILLMLTSAVLFWPLNVLAQESITTTREERLSQLVADQQISLDEATRLFIISKCKGAQQILSNIKNETDKLVKIRIDVYGGIQEDLQAVKLRMLRQGADSSETDLLTGKIQQGLDKFTVQAAEYGTTLDDVMSVDCQAKPEQFKAGLIYMRVQRGKLLSYANDLKAIIANSSSTTFEPLKKRLSI